MKEIFERARALISKPVETWQAIKSEKVSVQDLFINYAAPLALIPAVSGLIGLSIVGVRMPTGILVRAPFMEALAGAVLGYIFHLLGILAGIWLVNLLAPYFKSRPDFNSAAKLVIYSMTPVWLLGVISIIPGLGVLQILGLYAIYLLYLGLPVLMETPREKAIIYTVLIMVAWLLVSLVLTIIVGGAVYGPLYMRMMSSL